MGRRVPIDNISLIGPFLYFSFSFLGFATSIAIIIALCSFRFRRKSPPRPQPCTLSNESIELTKSMNLPTPPISTTMQHGTTIFTSPEHHPHTSEETKLENKTESENNEVLVKELPLPPAMLQQQQPPNNKESEMVKRATSERRISFSLSMKKIRSLSMVTRNREAKEDKDNGIGKKEKLKADESVWMKTIILGGKCVPDDDEDVVIYEEKGKKIEAYHPRKSPSFMSLSRQWSSISVDVPQSHDEKINNI